MSAPILHTADLHLSDREERSYGLAILDEIFAIAKSEKAGTILFAGDLFDTFSDAESLRDELRRRVQNSDCRCLFLPGNHERLRRPANGDLRHFDFSAELIACPPPDQADNPDSAIERIEGDWFELIALAESADSESIAAALAKLPPPGAERLRIVAAHGSVAGMSFTGLDEEENAAALDPQLIARCGAKVALLGHIHAGRSETLHGVLMHYPGSARVWRRHESGKRHVTLLSPGPQLRGIELKSAGQFHLFELSIERLAGERPKSERDATLDAAISAFCQAHNPGPNDFLLGRLSGFAESDHEIQEIEKQLLERLSALDVRRLEVDSRVELLQGVLDHPLSRRLLSKLDADPRSESEPERSRMARRLILKAIADSSR